MPQARTMDKSSKGIILFNVLVRFLSTLRRKIEDIVELSSQLEIEEHRQTLNSSLDEVSGVYYCVAAIANRQDTAALSSLLNIPDVLKSLYHLLRELNSAYLLSKKMEQSADSLAKYFTTGTSEINTTAGRISDHFMAFFALYTRHQPLLEPSFTSSAILVNQRAPLHEVQLAFYNQPFTFVLEKSSTDEIAAQLSATSDNDIYTLAIQEMAKQWVDDQLMSGFTAQQAQKDLLTVLSSLISTQMANIEESVAGTLQVESLRYACLVELQDRVDEKINTEQKKRFSLAFCGLIKVGKSTLLNALMGRAILPSGELFSTACPCRIQHVEGRSEPTLTIDRNYFQRAIEKLRIRLNESADNDCLLFEEDRRVPTWKEKISDDLDPRTMENLHKFEQNNYSIPGKVSGSDRVKDLLVQLNDIVGLCFRLGVMLPLPNPGSWPRLEIEIEALRERNLEGCFEFFDLPVGILTELYISFASNETFFAQGLGEFESSANDFSLEVMIRQVAENIRDVVPVVSLKEAFRDDWRRQLPAFIEGILGRSPELVICTHLDQVADSAGLIARVARGFKIAYPENHVLKCDSRLGLSARETLRQLKSVEPTFDCIRPNPATSSCVTRILGEYNPAAVFKSLDVGEWWRPAVIQQLEMSGLPDIIERLMSHMESPKRASKIYGERLGELLRIIINAQRSLVLSALEHSRARYPISELIDPYKSVLLEWSSARTSSMKLSRDLEYSSAILEAQGCKAASGAIRNMEAEGSKLLFSSVSDAEDFLRRVMLDLFHNLSATKGEFIRSVRARAAGYLDEHFSPLEEKIKSLRRNSLQDQLIDELQYRRASVESMVFSLMRSDALTQFAAKHDVQGTLHSIRGQIAKLVSSQAADTSAREWNNRENWNTNEFTTHIERLGFMRRESTAVIPPFRSCSRLLTKHSEGYLVEKKDLLEQLMERIVRPFCNDLKEEGKQTLNQMWENSFDAAQHAVNEVLEDVEKRYENAAKQSSADALAVSRLLSFIAAGAALEKLQTVLVL